MIATEPTCYVLSRGSLPCRGFGTQGASRVPQHVDHSGEKWRGVVAAKQRVGGAPPRPQDRRRIPDPSRSQVPEEVAELRILPAVAEAGRCHPSPLLALEKPVAPDRR